MADYVSLSRYVELATYYADARDLVTGLSGELYSAVIAIAGYDDLLPSYDLVTPFYDSYVRSANEFATPAPLLDAVRALNSHCISRGGYASIDAYLAAQGAGAVLPDTWQDLSTAAGYPIDPVYIA